jgi:hypothetical protein
MNGAKILNRPNALFALFKKVPQNTFRFQKSAAKHFLHFAKECLKTLFGFKKVPQNTFQKSFAALF